MPKPIALNLFLMTIIYELSNKLVSFQIYIKQVIEFMATSNQVQNVEQNIDILLFIYL